jgi:hypothetical protein
MLMVDLPESEAIRLQSMLEGQGHLVELVQEERFFGDAAVVTLILENTASVVAILAGAVTLFDKAKVIVSKSDSEERYEISKMSSEEIKAKLMI